MNLKKSIPAHPVLLAVYPVLFLYAQNVDFTPVSEALAPMAIAGGFSLLLLLSLSFALRDRDKAGLLVSLAVAIFFSYGHFSEAMTGWASRLGEVNLRPDVMLMHLWGAFLGVGTYALVKTRRDLRALTNPLNVVTLCLVVLSLARVVSYELRKSTWAHSGSGEEAEANVVALGEMDTLPDIYYIILDAYASLDSLEEIWDYDNHEFIDYLTEKGFYVVREGRSNHTITFVSLASSLNMEYLNYLGDELGTDSKDRTRPYQMTQNSKVVRFLRARGYKFVHFQSGWGTTARNLYADRDIKCGNVSEFIGVLVRTTILRPLANRFISHDRRAVVLCTFATLPEVQRVVEGPRFVFAHILVPHPPFLFGPAGEPLDTDPGFQPRDWSRYYLGQLEFVNKKVEVLVEQLLSEAEIPPIIILQADHGSRLGAGPPERIHSEFHGILNAYYLPDDGQDLLYDSITPVNTFRLIFNLYFDAGYDLLEDRMYFSRLNRPYDFLDVTDSLRGT